MDPKKTVAAITISIISLSLFMAIHNTTTENEQDSITPLPQCSIVYAPNFTPSNSWHWSVEEVMNRTIKGFDDRILFENTDRLEREDWPSALGIEPPCFMAKGALHIEGENVGTTYRPVVGFTEYYGVENATMPKGEVYLAHYAVPTTGAIWRIREYWVYPEDRAREETPVAECNCSREDVIKATLGRIEKGGFIEIESSLKTSENNCFELITSRLYKGPEGYLYVEFARVRGLDLIRVLMVMGKERGVVEAYSRAISAGSPLEGVNAGYWPEHPNTSACKLSMNPEFTPVNAWAGWSVRRPLGNLYVEYNDGLAIMPQFSPRNVSSENPPGALYGVDWPSRIGITPKCAIADGQVAFVTWNTKNATGAFCPTVRNKLCAINRQSPLLPGGKVYLATYVIPRANTTWVIQENLACRGWNNFLEPATCGKRETTIRGACTCPTGTVINQLGNAINAAGFEEVSLEKKPVENDYFRPLSVKLYRKEGQYLYVEFAEVKGMDMVRVLMILGKKEEVVKAYAEAFTAGHSK
ncbi:hypothetical protein [Thermococcus sp. MV11]|uniref:hypothetical protein n=1 Tax=Thermococcus sp. MV11 TaxID=1638267 RepID=UPI0014316113|nr:hypothetical protein [Thermococcus sp. MV11]NJE03716.1 hypothetical protein [Thermococcus sp. MV11]